MLKEKLNFYIIVAFASTLGILTDYFFYGKTVGVSFLIFILIIIAFSLIVARIFDQKTAKIQIFLIVSAILISSSVFLRSNQFLRFFDIIACAYLIFLFFALFADKNILNFRFLKYIAAPIALLFRSLGEAAKPINKYLSFPSASEKAGSMEFRSVIKGIILSLPILFVLGLLLCSADSVFRIYLDKFIQIKIDIVSLARFLKIAIVFYFSVGIFYFIGAGGKTAISEEKNGKIKTLLGFIESATVLIMVELLFIIFIAIQFFYLFGGKDYVWGVNEYITYAEYAKNGFNELILVSIISLALIYAVDKSSKKETDKQKNAFKFLSVALFIEISIILLSSFKRLSVYMDGYGLTFPRFLAFAFLFWIFGIFVAFLYKTLAEKKDGVFLAISFMFTVIFWTFVNISNPDAIIAKTNIERVAQGKKLDPYYFSRLSEDAVPEIVKIFKMGNVDEKVKEQIASDLIRQYTPASSRCDSIEYNNAMLSGTGISSSCKFIPFGETLQNFKTKENKSWQSFNLSKEKAFSALKDNVAEIEKYQFRYREKQVLTCKENVAKCEADCATNDWQSPAACKAYCNLQDCEEFEESIKILE